MTISEKSAYLKGLAEGMKLDTEKTEGKLISELIGLVSEIASAVEVLDEETTAMADYVDELDRDLGDLEEYVWDEECDEDEDDDEFFDEDDDDFEYGEYTGGECDGSCESCSGCDDDGDVFDVDSEGMRCIMCENCGDTICYDENLDPADIVCPGCGKSVVEKTEE